MHVSPCSKQVGVGAAGSRVGGGAVDGGNLLGNIMADEIGIGGGSGVMHDQDEIKLRRAEGEGQEKEEEEAKRRAFRTKVEEIERAAAEKVNKVGRVGCICRLSPIASRGLSRLTIPILSFTYTLRISSHHKTVRGEYLLFDCVV